MRHRFLFPPATRHAALVLKRCKEVRTALDARFLERGHHSVGLQAERGQEHGLAHFDASETFGQPILARVIARDFVLRRRPVLYRFDEDVAVEPEAPLREGEAPEHVVDDLAVFFVEL